MILKVKILRWRVEKKVVYSSQLKKYNKCKKFIRKLIFKVSLVCEGNKVWNKN